MLANFFLSLLQSLRPIKSDTFRIALVSDGLTRNSLLSEVPIVDIAPSSYRAVLRRWRPDFLLVESAWEGYRRSWKFKIAAYPDYPERNNHALKMLVSCAKDLGIPTVFWNKEDSAHFDRFIDSALMFDHIFTVDENCILRYKQKVDNHVSVNTLMFAVQPKIHYFKGINHTIVGANFVGSYSRHIHDDRRDLQHMLFNSASEHLGLTVYDRNSNRKSSNYRYPDDIKMKICPSIPYATTASVYRDYLVSLNVNTVTDSPTMFSRRLIEIMACGGLAVTTPALSIDTLFSNFCYTVNTKDQADELFKRLKRDGLSHAEREMIHEGAAYIANNHTWSQRIEEILAVIGTAGR